MFDWMLTAEQKRLQEEVREFVRSVPRQLILDMDADKVRYPREYIRWAAERNLLGLRFPAEYGGRGLRWEDEIIALEEVGVLGTSLACLYSLPSIVGEAIAAFGTPAQKEKYLRPTLEGRLTCAEALTEPRGGSDFFGSTCQARREGDVYILNGQKRFVVGAEGADYFFVYARTRPEGPGRIYFRDARVPAENLVGEENCAAEIFWRMMIPERMTSAAGAIGMGRAALEVAARYSDLRTAFGQKIRRFQAVSFKVADALTQLDAARGLVYAAARAIDTGQSHGLIRRMVSEAKKCATETAWLAVNHAMQIMGGIGYTNVYPIERMLRDVRLVMIWTGTNEIMDLLIQHEYYKQLLTEGPAGRDLEMDAPEADRTDEKVYE
ncbi:MAG: acyl-CoA/acyl-ACP dehydrogenase [Chloroflexi bacterium]|nr:acyl-CoA/acyl-ACP dehydrogenase [Chloroflexota bacterium]